jgi:ribosomal protein S18 acetylase RimI-like enzyme
MAEILFESLPDKLRKHLPKYPLPAMRIGRLAVDKELKGQGIGEFLLMDALALGARLFSEVGIFSIIVDAKNLSAVKFYQKYGFIQFQDRKDSLFLPIKTVVKAFQ